MAGLPNSRCNFARVFVNGTLIGQGVGGVNSPGIFVNAEPVMQRYIERNFNGNMNGNLYELEHSDDFVSERLPFIGSESLSKFNNKADLQFADRPYRREWTGRGEPDAGPGSVHQSLCDGVLSQALGRLFQQHQ